MLHNQMIIAQILSSVSVISSLRNPLVLVMLTISPIPLSHWIQNLGLVTNMRKTLLLNLGGMCHSLLRTYLPSVKPLFSPESGYHSLTDASAVAAPVMPINPMNHVFPQPSVACDSFTVNITSCGDVDSSTVRPRIHTPLDYEPDVPTVPFGTCWNTTASTHT